MRFANPSSRSVPTFEQPSLAGSKRFPWNEGVGVLVGLATPFMVGNFPIAEALLLGLVCWAVIARVLRGQWPAGVFRTRWFPLLIVCAAVSLLGYVIADLYRDSASSDYLRGWARWIFLVVDIVGLAVLVGSFWRRWFAVKFGLAAGLVINAAIYGPLYGDWWKFGIGTPLTILVLALVGNRRLFAVAALIVLGVIHLFLEFRGMGGVCLFLAAILGAPAVSFRLRFPIIVVCLLVTAVFYVSYIMNAGSRRGGSDSERQAMIEAASLSFIESPFIGQGSWFSRTDIVGKIEARRRLQDTGFTQYDPEATDKLAVHSQLLVALAEGGILGGVFFLVFGLLLIWALVYGSASTGRWRPLALFFILEAIGNLLISPFSGPARVQIAAAVVLVLLFWQERQGRLPGTENYHA